jgi:pilus assembly protein Flp/PilA
MKNFLKMIRDSKGATAIEYGLIAALIAVAGVAAFQSLGTQISNTMTTATTKMKTT